jgi:hypothetical protein
MITIEEVNAAADAMAGRDIFYARWMRAMWRNPRVSETRMREVLNDAKMEENR